MKVSDIVQGVTALQKLNNMDLPISLALRLNKNAEECESVLKLFEERRKKIIADVALKEGESLPEESIQAIEDHLDEEIELDITKISLKALNSIDAKLSASDLTNISWMFDFDVEDE